MIGHGKPDKPDKSDWAPREICAAMLERIAAWLDEPPSEPTIAQLQSPEGQVLLDAIAQEFDARAAIAQLRAALAAGPASTLALDIAVDWTRLFEGVMGAPTVPLYESAYADDPARPAARLFGCAVDEMNELLVRFDVSLASQREPADHVSVELALYAVLLRRHDADGIALMRERLSRWVPALIELCRLNDPGGFHGAVASLLGVLLQHAPGLESQEWSHHAE
ncbi:TorD/DmsD family molecular chaperone [Cupriavidus agavae]|uniref:TorA-specific chaperone n=1 Tax=Cupriavidus agavae TaxID=1001822 RepID=A0A4Q7S906_9BURK|nr:molecular chaperone TorD family protein [Cupriavidus agavae]RZT42437.1 TorA-specific chaperone [Cupriavidus agavae]